MAAPNDKKRQLDDEMSRFEAEISGPPDVVVGALPPPPPPPSTIRPVIGSNTYNQVQRQLQRQAVGPPGPHDLSGPPITPGPPFPPRPVHMAPFGPHGPPGPLGPPHPGMHGLHRPPRPYGPVGPPGPPMVPRMRPQGAMIGPHLQPPPPPPPPGYIGPQPPNMGPPPPPPGFIPPQVNRAAMSSPMMPQVGPMMGPGAPTPLAPPPGYMRPPAPPGFIPPGSQQVVGPPPPPTTGIATVTTAVTSSATISKPPSVISSAPKIYAAECSDNAAKAESVGSESLSFSEAAVKNDAESESIRKKTKTELVPPKVASVNQLTHAQEMAEKVKQSMVTTTVSVGQTQGTATPEEKKKEKKPRKNLRYAGGQVWEDQYLSEWDADDFRIFCGDLGNDVTDELLQRYFSQYPSFVKAKVVREKRTSKSKGYGFISFHDPQDYIRAMKEMNGRYVGSRPIKLRKSTWRDRSYDVVLRKKKEKQLLGLK